MEKTADILPEKFSESVSKPPGKVCEDDHQYARKRVLEYLKTLGVPEQKAAELAAEVLQRAEREQGMHPVISAMRVLRVMLSENKIVAGYAAPPGEQKLSDSANVWSRDIISMPALNRDSMLPVEIDRKPWWTFFSKYILRKKQ
jgi:hypothetical protein